MKKILFVCSEFSPGMLPFASSVINTLSASNEIEPYVLAVSHEEFSYERNLNDLPPENITHIQYPKNKFVRLFYKIYPNKLWTQIRLITKKNNITIVHLLSGDFSLMAFAGRLNKRYDFFYSVHDLFPHEKKKGNWKDTLIDNFFIRATKRFIAKSDNLVSCNRQHYLYLKELYPRKNVFYHVFPSLITADITEGGESCPELESIHDYVLFFGAVNVYKGVDLLYDVFTEYSDFEDRILVIAGKGECYFSQKENESNILRIDRYVKDTEVRSLFENAKCVVYPYISATQTGVMTLAYKFGTPLIASDIDYFKDCVIEGKTGYLFRQNDKHDLSITLNNVLALSDHSEMRDEQRKYYRSHFSREALMTELLLIYKNQKS